MRTAGLQDAAAGHPGHNRASSRCARLVSVTGIVLVSFLTARGATGQVEAATLKAVFIERFARFVTWPDSVDRADPSTPFVISILGDAAFADAVESVYGGRTILGKDVRVRRISSVTDVGSSRVLYVGRSQERRLAEIVRAVRGEPILTVAESEGFGERGIHINFVVSGRRLGFHVNRDELGSSPLDVSYVLLRAARNVGRGS